MPESSHAVFLSYASQDVEAARRVSESLRAAGVEVWLDQEGGLVGGDAWDRKIREQINACALFVPVISAATQARHEGNFRLEWKLAAQPPLDLAPAVPAAVSSAVGLAKVEGLEKVEGLAKADKSVAVLPFANLSPDPENAFFCDGMHEDILTTLANIRNKVGVGNRRGS